MTQQDSDNPSGAWASILREVPPSVRILALVVLVVEVVLAGLAAFSAGPDRTYLIVGMIAIILLIVGLVGGLLALRPEVVGAPNQAIQGMQAKIDQLGQEKQKLQVDYDSLQQERDRLAVDMAALRDQSRQSHYLGPLAGKPFEIEVIQQTVANLTQAHRRRDADMLPMRELFSELNGLFNDLTFRGERVMDCLYQYWSARVHVTWQTWVILGAYDSNVRDYGTTRQYKLLQDLRTAVYDYCMDMSQHLFKPPLQEAAVRPFIGTPEFDRHLTDPILFEKDTKGDGKTLDMDPAVDENRARAVELMDALMKTI